MNAKNQFVQDASTNVPFVHELLAQATLGNVPIALKLPARFTLNPAWTVLTWNAVAALR